MQQADREIRGSSPLRCVGLLSLHDAIEIFLDTAAEVINAPLGTTRDFKDYWSSFAKVVPPIRLPMQRALEKINRARVALKHHGQRPNDDQLHDYVITAYNFFEDVCPRCFDIAFDEISMINLIKDENTRDLLHVSAEKLSEKEYRESICEVAKAFVSGSKAASARLYYNFSPQHLPPDAPGWAVKIITELSIDYGRAISFVNLGIDLRDYWKFKQLTPRVHQSESGKFSTAFVSPGAPSQEEVQWCIDFVTMFVLRAESCAAS